jgi:hypothetical protein
MVSCAFLPIFKCLVKYLLLYFVVYCVIIIIIIIIILWLGGSSSAPYVGHSTTPTTSMGVKR